MMNEMTSYSVELIDSSGRAAEVYCGDVASATSIAMRLNSRWGLVALVRCPERMIEFTSIAQEVSK